MDFIGADVSVLSYNNKFKAIYFSTQDMKNSMSSWPEIVFIDGTYSLTDSDLTVMLMVVEDSNGTTNIVAVGLVAAEDLTTVKWLLSTFRENRGQVTSKIQCFMSDKDMVGRRVLHELFPGVRIYICLFHTLQAMKRALSKKNNLSWFERLMKLAYSASEEQYLQKYNVFCSDAPDDVAEYYNKNWHVIREDWTVYSMRYGNLMNLTNNRLESMNQKLKQVVPKRSTLLKLLELLFKYIDLQMAEINNKAAKNFTKNKTNVVKGTSKDQYMQLLTDFAFAYVSEQLTLSEKLEIGSRHGVEFFMRQKYTIIKITAISCECNDRASLRLPCRHILALRRSLELPLFEETLCDKRWTNKYYMQNQRIFNPPILSWEMLYHLLANSNRLRPRLRMGDSI